MVLEKTNGEYTDLRIPGIVVTGKGTLLRYCECRRSRDDWADIDIKISRSEDKGKSWQTVLVIKSGGNTLNNPVMFMDGEQLIFLYCKNYMEIWKFVSEDDGKNFCNDERVVFENDIDFFYNVVAVGPGHGIKHNNRLLVPIWFAYNQEDPKSHRPSFISTLYSDDHGKSWHIGDLIYKDILINPSECALAITESQEVLISVRHEGEEKKRGLIKSADGISGWNSICFEQNLPDPICMGSMTHNNGTIYHINCDSETERNNLTIKISDDCFKTYRNVVVSENGGYSDIALYDNKMYVFYEKINEEGVFELCFDVIDDKDV